MAARRGHGAAAAARRCGARDTHEICARLRLRAGARSDERRPAPPAGLAAPRGASRARARRAIAISSRCSPGRPRCCATTTSCSTRSRAEHDARRRGRARARCRARSRAGSSARWLGAAAARRSRRSSACSRSRAASARAVSCRAATASSASAARLAPRRAGATATPRAAPVALALPGRARFGAVEIEAWIEHGAAGRVARRRATLRCVDADRSCPTRSCVAAPRPGERFRPLGRGGSKLVRDALAEAGVAGEPRADAAAAPVRRRPTEPRLGRRLPYRRSRPGHRRVPGASSG